MGMEWQTGTEILLLILKGRRQGVKRRFQHQLHELHCMEIKQARQIYRAKNTEYKIYSVTYLFKGICSNGPVVGIVPHKSLLETSLKKKK